MEIVKSHADAAILLHLSEVCKETETEEERRPESIRRCPTLNEVHALRNKGKRHYQPVCDYLTVVKNASAL